MKSQLHPNALRNLQTLEPKKHVYKKKKKKGLSTLKKKILLERLQHHILSHAVTEKMRKETAGKKDMDIIQHGESKQDSDQYVCIYNLVDDSVDFQDEDERNEIMQNIQDLLRPFGPVHTISLWHILIPHGYVVRVRYWQHTAHRQVVQVLQGFVIAGERLELELHENSRQVVITPPAPLEGRAERGWFG
ncbi:hypothetical protein EON64_14205 [archaeon]|nr:MAG: hypothetical protein EON64_14205 [archaeon]